MKTIAALIAGLLLSTLTFVAGMGIALTFLNIDEPAHKLDTRNTAALWSTTPTVVDKTAQSFERVPARPIAKQKKMASLSRSATDAKPAIDQATNTNRATRDDMIDPVVTGSLETDRRDEVRDAQAAAHVEWCSRRYRSYNAESNTYRPFGGGRRSCQSPYSEFVDTLPLREDHGNMAAAVQPTTRTDDDAAAVVEDASFQDSPVVASDGDHVQSCFERYRSYRPGDNSYQPYYGGPRRQCE